MNPSCLSSYRSYLSLTVCVCVRACGCSGCNFSKWCATISLSFSLSLCPIRVHKSPSASSPSCSECPRYFLFDVWKDMKTRIVFVPRRGGSVGRLEHCSAFLPLRSVLQSGVGTIKGLHLSPRRVENSADGRSEVCNERPDL